MAHPRGWPKGRTAEHTHEHQPPRQTKTVNAGDDNWGIAGTSLGITDPKVSSHPGDAVAASIGGEYYMEPCYDDKRSVYLSDSRTNGKKE